VEATAAAVLLLKSGVEGKKNYIDIGNSSERYTL
jgi:hypothetical protein